MLVPALSDAEEGQSLVQTLSYLKEKTTGSWIRWDGGLFISATEYSDFRSDVKNQLLIVDEYWRTTVKSTGQVKASGWRRLNISPPALNPKLTDVRSQQSFSGSSTRVFFVSLISRENETAITLEGTEKRGDKPERAISGAWPECYLVFHDQDCAKRLRQALVRAMNVSNSKKE
jgi:hypothetical protein